MGAGTRSKAKHTRPRYAGRSAAAATATGLMSKHLAQLNAFLDEALASNRTGE
jgi:2-oxoglutarate dehydrogenase E1 component